MKIGLFIAGYKGLNFLKNIHLDHQIAWVCSYKSKGDIYGFSEEIKSLCLKENYTLIKRQNCNKEMWALADLIFVVGWQYILPSIDEKLIIFHDSLLPKFRGFSPTVTALIKGERTIGVTALKASNSVDTGEIYEQKSIEIEHPIKIKEAYLRLAKAYAEVANSIIAKTNQGKLTSVAQDESKATYSIWRNENDYYIDWKWDAKKISRFVFALGWPYQSARTIYQSEIIYIDEVTVIQDKYFEDRHPGKIWNLNQGMPEIICGQGMIQIISARKEDQSRVIFDRVREKLHSTVL